jgi:hypothetical protein
MMEWIIAGIATVFSAGVAWGVSRTQVAALRRELNGLGKSVREAEKATKKELKATREAVLVACPADQRIDIANLLKD